MARSALTGVTIPHNAGFVVGNDGLFVAVGKEEDVESKFKVGIDCFC